MRPVIYTALFVKDKEELLRYFTPAHDNVYADHITIKFRPENIDDLVVGREHFVEITGRAQNENGDALIVECPLLENKHFHLTLSCADEIKPFYSNGLVENAIKYNTAEYLKEKLRIVCVEGYYDGENVIIK